MVEGVDTDEIELLINGDHLADGGAAMTAYPCIQFSEMGDIESREIQKALLKYCELDTPAMEMIWEYRAKEVIMLITLCSYGTRHIEFVKS